MKARKKPVTVEAHQFFPERKPWPEGVVGYDKDGMFCDVDGVAVRFKVTTPNGGVDVEPGEWILTGIKGEKYPIKDHIFRESYEVIDAAGA